MTLDEFRTSLEQGNPPTGISPALRALWYDACHNWDEAHAILQNDNSPDGAWVHAYLHRVEGDLANAGYWYQRANRVPCNDALPVEWEAIAQELLARA